MSNTATALVNPAPTIILRGWKQICPFVGFKDYRTARKHLKEMGLLSYENGRPYLSVDNYRLRLMERQYPKKQSDTLNLAE